MDRDCCLRRTLGFNRFKAKSGTHIGNVTGTYGNKTTLYYSGEQRERRVDGQFYAEIS